MRRAIEKLMAKNGTDMTLVSSGGEKTVRGFFRAVNSGSWQSLESKVTPLGEAFRGQYSYIGPADGAAREGDTLDVGGKSYLFRRVGDYLFRGESLYQWGLCVEKGVNDTWGA